MIPDLSQMEEVQCPDCHSPVVFSQVEGLPNRLSLDGCRCDREQYTLPDGVLLGIDGGPFFLYAPKAA